MAPVDFENKETRFQYLTREIKKRTGDPLSGVFDWDYERGGNIKAFTYPQHKQFVPCETATLDPYSTHLKWIDAILKDFTKFGANRLYSHSCYLPKEFGIMVLYKGGPS